MQHSPSIRKHPAAHGKRAVSKFSSQPATDILSALNGLGLAFGAICHITFTLYPYVTYPLALCIGSASHVAVTRIM
jgi:hypothetical protein